MALQEHGFDAVEKGIGCQPHRIAEEFEVDIGIEVEFQLSCQGTGYPRLCTEVEVEALTLGLTEQSTEADIR